mgnify:CR=1 FL=1
MEVDELPMDVEDTLDADDVLSAQAGWLAARSNDPAAREGTPA